MASSVARTLASRWVNITADQSPSSLISLRLANLSAGLLPVGRLVACRLLPCGILVSEQSFPEPDRVHLDMRTVASSAIAGSIAALVDVLAASLISATHPVRILRTIAGGVLGPRTFELAASWLLGLALQILMGILIASLFLLARQSIPRRFGRFQIALGGATVVFAVMNYVVLPLSAWRRFADFDLRRGVLSFVAMLVFSMIVVYGGDLLSNALRRP